MVNAKIRLTGLMLVAAAVAAAACTFTRPLDDLQSGFGASDGGIAGTGGGTANGGNGGGSGSTPDAEPAMDARPVPSHCRNGRRDADESGMDCGGACGTCIGAACNDDRRCASGACSNGTCECPTGMSRNHDPTTGVAHCIDNTEVTNAAYAAFLRDCEAPHRCEDAQAPQFCGGNTFLPSYPRNVALVKPGCLEKPFSATGAAAGRPVVCVDWCDAYAYCKHVGKRLCGRWSDQPTPYDAWNDIDASEWFNACTAGAPLVYPYPYGMFAVDQICVGTPDNGAARTSPEPVASFPQCHGPAAYEQVFDMVGNVREWENSCSTTPGDDACRVRGGGYDRYAAELACRNERDEPRGRLVQDPSVGFRCCAF